VETVDENKISREDAALFLEEAVELFQRCLVLQEYQYTESRAQSEAMQDPDQTSEPEEGGASLSESSSQPPQDDRWATIVEPVTNDTILDTLLAQLQTLALFCTLIDINAEAGRGLAWIEEYSTPLITTKLQTYLQDTTNREVEAGLTKANFIAALVNANFRAQKIDVTTYERTLNDIFSSLNLDDNPEGLCNRAEALITYDTSLRLNPNLNSDEISLSRWKALTAALDSLTKASKLPSADNLPAIHLLRGDVELLRCHLGRPPTNYDVASKNAGVLLKNAEKFYRGAGNLAKNEGSTKQIAEATCKEALAAYLGGDLQKIKEIAASEMEGTLREVLGDAVNEGLVTNEWRATIE